MYEDSQYLVIRTNKGHRKGYPFDSFQDALVKAIKVAQECSEDEKYSKANVEVGIWDGEEFEDSVGITECKDDFDYVLQNTDKVVSVFDIGGIASGKCFNFSSESIGDSLRAPEEHVIYIEGNDVIDMGTDWRTYAVFLSWRLLDEVDIKEVCNILGIKEPSPINQE